MVAILVLTAQARASSAQPTDQDREAFEACKRRRHELTVEAMKVPELVERGRRLEAMPTCTSTPTVASPRPFTGTLEVAVRAGVTDIAPGDQSFGAAGRGPYLELEAGARAGRLTVATFVGYTSVHDPSAIVGDDPLSHADLHVNGVDVGIRAHVSVAAGFFVGVGLGLEDWRASGTAMDENGSWTVSTDSLAGLLEFHAGVTLPKLGSIALQLFGMVSMSTDDAYTSRIAIGMQL